MYPWKPSTFSPWVTRGPKSTSCVVVATASASSVTLGGMFQMSQWTANGSSATRAKLDRPGGLAVGPGGELYVSDTGNDRVRVVAPDGTLRTVAGSSTPGYSGDGGPATNAGLNSPSGLWLLDSEVLLISDHFNHRVRAVRLVS